MRFSVALFSVTLFVASHASSLVSRSAFETLILRQTSTNSCTDTCTPFQTSLDNCTSTSCLCTTAVVASLQACIDCAVAASIANPTSSVITAAQTLRTTFESTCAGFNLPAVTIAGVTSSSTSASGASRSATVAASTTITNIATTSATASQIVVRPSSDTATDTATATSTTTSGGYAIMASKELLAKALAVVAGAAIGMGLVF